MLRHALLCISMTSALIAVGQAAMIKVGDRFERSVKNQNGDIHHVINGVLMAEGNALIHVLDQNEQKVIRLDAALVPQDELSLSGIPFEDLQWNGVSSIVIEGSLHILLVAQEKNATHYALAPITDRGAPAFGTVRRLASSELPFVDDPTNSLVYRPLPDLILQSRGLQFAHEERLTPAPDGQHFLLNNYTFQERGKKQFWYAFLNADMNVEWSGTAELPTLDANSRIHQVLVSNDGVIHLLIYNFRCASEEQRKDKLCHELRLISLVEKGTKVVDNLIEKDFVSTARCCLRDSGRVAVALRYGALTGQPGVVATFDPMDPKLKTTPVLDQHAPSIRTSKLLAYGSLEATSKSGRLSRTAKVPDEIVELLPAWSGGLLVVETVLDDAFELPFGEAIAMRRVVGDIRLTHTTSNDTIAWQTTAERAFMTTAGKAYETVRIIMEDDDVTLLYDHTPQGLEGILKAGSSPDQQGSGGKKGRPKAPDESGVMKMTKVDPTGVARTGTCVMLSDGLMPCPARTLCDPDGDRLLVRSYDRETGYNYTLVDPARVGD